MNDRVILVALLLIGWIADCCWAVDFYVAPNGNDAWSGTLKEPNTARTDGPLASLTRARDAVRALKTAGRFTEPVTISVRGGTHFLAQPLVLTPQDSGTAEWPITYRAYPGEHPLLSGGRPITGWKSGEKGLWQADVTEVRRGRWPFRQVWVNGSWRNRPRVPETGAFPVAGPAAPDTAAFQCRPGDFRESWAQQKDLEIVVLQFWTEARLPLEKFDPATRTVVLRGGSWRPLTWSMGYFVENARDALGKPGQWYLDRNTGTVSYVPREKEDMATAEVIAPLLEQLVRLEGKPEAWQLVEHVGFQGLRFAHTAWRLPDKGLACPQAEIAVAAMLFAEGACHCRIEDSEFSNADSWAIELGRGCVGNSICRNEIHDLGAGGVKIGDYSAVLVEGAGTGKESLRFRDVREEARDTLVADNVLRDCAKTYFGAVGVWIGQSSGNKIIHNEIAGTWQWAVSVGWNWGYGADFTRDNLVEFNHVHHIGSLLGSHSSIYTLGIQPGTVIRNNLIHHGAGYGLGLDQATTGVLAENNLVHHQQAGGLHFNWDCLGNVIQNNIFALNGGPKQGQWTRYGDAPRGEDTNCNVMMRNIVYWNNSRLWNEERWPNWRMILDFNLYFDASGKPLSLLGLPWDQWKTKTPTIGFAIDHHSVVADPRFVAPERDDFRLKPDSPARKLGFREFDLRAVGPRVKNSK
jgi:hypothetical protein